MTSELLIRICLLPAKQLHFFSQIVFDYASAFVFFNSKNWTELLSLSQTRNYLLEKNTTQRLRSGLY